MIRITYDPLLGIPVADGLVPNLVLGWIAITGTDKAISYVTSSVLVVSHLRLALAKGLLKLGQVCISYKSQEGEVSLVLLDQYGFFLPGQKDIKILNGSSLSSEILESWFVRRKKEEVEKENDIGSAVFDAEV